MHQQKQKILQRLGWPHGYIPGSSSNFLTDENGLLHSRDDRPALQISAPCNVINIWCYHGLIHRDISPAVLSDYHSRSSGYFFHMDRSVIPSHFHIELQKPFHIGDEIYLPLKKINNRIYECLVGNNKQYVSIDIFGSVPDEYLP